LGSALPYPQMPPRGFFAIRRSAQILRVATARAHKIRVRKHSEDAVKAHVEEHGKKRRAVITK
jgi:hypothetical protein